MSEEEVRVAHKAPMPLAVDQTAPAVVFDGFTAVGHINGLFSLTLAISRPTLFTDNIVRGVATVSGQLCCTYGGLLQLRDAIDKALLLAAPADQAKN